MVAKKAGTALRYIEYMGVFLCFFLMYLFIIPQSDVFPFAHAIDGSFSSAVTYSLQYGNGRLLGNTIGAFFLSFCFCRA